jgi:hypothetical protein
MFRPRSFWIIALFVFCAAFAGCRGDTGFGSGNQSSGNSSVVLAMTDTPPSNVSILSAEVTLTGATLNPGNVSLFSGSKLIELTRLQTDTAYLATASNVSSGSYTSLSLTFANPLLTIENDTTAAIVSGSTTCAIGSICTIAPTTTANLATTITLSSFSIAANSTAGLLVDVNLDNLLSATMGEDFKAGTTVSSFTPGGTGALLVGAEDVVGQITALDTAHNTFSIQNVTGTYSLAVDNSSSFFQFPTSACTTSGIACLGTNQIVSVDISIGSNGSAVARNVVYEDADSSDTEVEGFITSTNAGSQQFNIVTLDISAAGTGLSIGQIATVHYAVAPQTPFDVDFVHADNVAVSTSGYLFAAPTDLSVGQEVSIRRNSSSSGNSITADRVRLRSTRITATVHTIGAPYIYLYNPPSIFSGNAITQIQVLTSTPTIYSENGVSKDFSEVFVPGVISVRGPLFNANIATTRNLVATRIVIVP